MNERLARYARSLKSLLQIVRTPSLKAKEVKHLIKVHDPLAPGVSVPARKVPRLPPQLTPAVAATCTHIDASAACKLAHKHPNAPYFLDDIDADSPCPDCGHIGTLRRLRPLP